MKVWKRYPGFVLRTVRKGQIKFNGRMWRPDESPVPPDRLDNKVFGFIVYPELREIATAPKLLCLWGSKALANALNSDNGALCDKVDKEEVELLAPDGYFRQYWWRPV